LSGFPPIVSECFGKKVELSPVELLVSVSTQFSHIAFVRSGPATLARVLALIAQWQGVPHSCHVLCLMSAMNAVHNNGGESIDKKFIKRKKKAPT
jgi:hypothetical protein